MQTLSDEHDVEIAYAWRSAGLIWRPAKDAAVWDYSRAVYRVAYAAGLAAVPRSVPPVAWQLLDTDGFPTNWICLNLPKVTGDEKWRELYAAPAGQPADERERFEAWTAKHWQLGARQSPWDVAWEAWQAAIVKGSDQP